MLAAGIPVVAGVLGQARPGVADGVPTRSPTALVTPTAGRVMPPTSPQAGSPPSWLRLVTPVVPAQVRSGTQVPITAKSVAALLLDELPPGARANGLGATTNDVGLATVEAAVRAPAGTGEVVFQMTKPGAAEPQPCSAEVACKTYHLADGVIVQEEASRPATATPVPAGSDYLIDATVWRPGGGSVMVEATDYPFNGSAAAAPGAPPLTMAQVVAAAADPRWAWTMDSSFVAKSASLTLTGPAPLG